MQKIQVSIVMPCLNEARSLPACIAKARQGIAATGLSGEIIVADNGSTDGSERVAQDCGARVIHVSEPGYGAAVHAGVLSARGMYVVMGDSDDSYDFQTIKPFIAKLEEGYDLVVGNRFEGGITPGAMKWSHRYFGVPMLTFALNMIYGTKLRDAHSGLRAFRRDAYLQWKLKCTGMEFASEMILRAACLGDRITQVPTRLSQDGRDHPSHLRTFRDGFRHLVVLLLHAFDARHVSEFDTLLEPTKTSVINTIKQ